MFYDLNIQNNIPEEDKNKILALQIQLGFDAVALNYCINIDSKDKNTIKHSSTIFPEEIEVEENYYQSLLISPPAFTLRCDRELIENKQLIQYKRITICTEDDSQRIAMKGANQNILDSYDIVAIKPQNDKAFNFACTKEGFVFDIISLDCAEHLNIKLSTKLVNQAIQRGIFFEVNYAPALRDTAARKRLISNTSALVGATGGRNIIMSSEANEAMELRGPYDVINLAGLFGLNQGPSKRIISSNCESVLAQAQLRKQRNPVFNVQDVENLLPLEKWKISDEIISFEVQNFKSDNTIGK